ncbi:MAG TPA: EAL domain-containing protein [Gammaproteobacteria bacterium]|nr:EAL domain-containing protein [Gammaproteobacteria bacterium]
MKEAFSLIPIQHELAMSIGRDIRLKPMLAEFMKVCVHRLSLRSCHIYLLGKFTGDSCSENDKLQYFTSFPATQKKTLHQQTFFSNWLASYETSSPSDTQPIKLDHDQSSYHIFPVGDFGLVILERTSKVLANELIAALVPIIERLAVSCNASLEHERTLSEISKREALEIALREQLKFSKAITKIAELVAVETNDKAVINGMSRILGETLELDLVSIYDVNFSIDIARRTNEWRNLDTANTVIAPEQFPLSLFRATNQALQSKIHAKKSVILVSHFDAPFHTLLEDGAADLLHNDLQIKSLLWQTLLHHNEGFHLLALKQTSYKRIWRQEETVFINSVVHHVSTALKKFELIRERKKADARIRQMAYYDDLTVLPNRTMLMDQLNRELSFGIRHKLYSAILFLDLDRFKNINDSLGHSAGDALLREVALRLKKVIRSEDIVARLGGDEFVILLSQLSNSALLATKDAEQVAEKTRQVLSEPYKLLDHEYHVTPSIGIALLPEGEESTADDILKHADTAMYHAKAAGRDAIKAYQPAMQIAADERLSLEKDLRLVIERKELLLQYQPQFNQNGILIGVEALLRWQHPERGLITPDDFISIAEDTGQILRIGDWVLENAAIQVKKWIDLRIFPGNATLAVNVSPKQFRQNNYIDSVKNILNEVGINPKIVKLEITEGIVMSEIDNTISKMHSLRRYGVGFSVDDFGTGYSSLAYLKTLPLSQLKIDKSFVQDITCDPNDATIVETIIIMANTLGLDVIAEGVETQDELRFLVEKGCKKYQGYYFSRALDSQGITLFLQATAEKR